ncbi:MAG: hypothetical protein QOD87_444 [Pseudonocardiales bacterium]|nr:hypothetical protein [Pseudonocardiales bacterium]
MYPGGPILTIRTHRICTVESMRYIRALRKTMFKHIARDGTHDTTSRPGTTQK